MITAIVLVVSGYFIERKFSPRVKSESGTWFLHYTKAKGSRDKVKIV